MSGAGTRILVVDDERGIRDLLRSELAAGGYEVETAANGEEALERFRAGRFPLVITDVKMPRMDGLEMLAAVKKIDPDAEVIVSTAFGSIEMAIDAMKRGAYDFVQKPFNLDEILALVEKALEKCDLKASLAIYEASRAVFSSMSLDALMPRLVEITARSLLADDASIMLLAPDGTLAIAAAIGGLSEEQKGARLRLGERVAGKVALSRSPVIIAGPLADDPRFADVPPLRPVLCSIVFPLVNGDQLLGVLNVNRTTRDEPFTAADLRHASVLGSQMAQAIHNARLYAALEEKLQEIQGMQLQLVQHEKMAAIGRLAAGVAHEINNPLTGVQGFAQMLLEEEGLNESQRSDLRMIRDESRRCGNIVKGLLQFSRTRPLAWSEVSMAGLIDHLLETSQPSFEAAGARLETDVPSGLPAFRGDAEQLLQVFRNLATNALHALEGHPDGRLLVRARVEGDLMVVRFSDNGCGIPADALGKIFDPFFTTKPLGKGTGLGLSIAYGIVQQHGGTVRAESAPGRGAEFTLSLPLGGTSGVAHAAPGR